MNNKILEDAKKVFDIEISALKGVASSLNENLVKAISAIEAREGKVIVTGLGKSGAVGRKIAATLSSTGTPTVFIHAAEGLHGDLGIIDKKDIAIAISYSGETNELSLLIPAIKRLGVKLIAITGKLDSTLGRAADISLSVNIDKEACPLGLAPTSSTTAILVMGDALAVALYRAKNFTAEDFALRHPGGALGRSLKKVSELMHKGEEIPVSNEDDSMSDVIIEMTKKKLGMTCIVNSKGKLKGIVTDGDLRRLMQKRQNNALELKASEVMTKSPRTINETEFAVKALTVMEENKITSLVVADKMQRPVGVIHIHDILRSKVV